MHPIVALPVIVLFGSQLALAGEAMACNLLYEDAAEGMDAFLDKRAAVWRGR